jgi:signal transduction histidine kinase
VIEADDVRLRQLVHNLVKNSLETLEGEGWIKLKTEYVENPDSSRIEFTVEDSGKGIAEEVSTNLFDPYVTTKTSGSGLGLAIVQKIVDEHGGSVRVGKARGGGAKFTIRLPVSHAANETHANPAVEPLKTKVMP